MDPLDRLCLRIARRRTAERALARLVPALALAAFLAAVAAAVVRLAVPGGGWLLPALSVLAPLAPLILLPAVLRRRDPAWLLAAHADRLAAADGLAMALAAQPAGQRDPAWNGRLRQRLDAAQLPALRRPPLLPAAGALLLLAGAWFLPQATAAPVPLPVLGASLRSAEERLAELKAQELAPPPELAALAERLETVRAAVAAQGLNQQTWAALDALDRDLGSTRAAAADRLADALAKAEALGGLPADAGAEATARAAADLAAALADLEQHAPGLGLKLPPGAEGAALMRLAQQAAAGGELTPEQRAALERWGLAPGGQGQDGAGAGGDAAGARALAQRLADQLARKAGAAGDGDGGNAEGQGQSGHSDNAPGHIELTWGAGDRVPGGYRDRLAPGQTTGSETTATVGTQSRAPRDGELAGGTGSAAAATDQAAAAADARAARHAPRHRPAVGAYFAITPLPPPGTP